jgi:multidrug resistance efflux pump
LGKTDADRVERMNEYNSIFIEEITDSKEAMQAATPPVGRWFITIISIVVVFTIIFLFFFQREVAISAQGVIEPSKPTESISTASGGKIAVSRLENGAFVNAGDVLIEFDASYAEQRLVLLEPQVRNTEKNIESLELLRGSYIQDMNLLALDDPYYAKYEEYSAEKSIIIENSNIGSAESKRMQETANDLIVYYQGRIAEIDWRISELSRLHTAVTNNQQFDSSDTYVKSIYTSFLSEYNPCQQALDDAATKRLEAEQKFENGIITQSELDIIKASEDAAKSQLDLVVAGYGEKIQTEIESSNSQKKSYEDQIAQLQTQNDDVDKSVLLPPTLDQLRAQKISEAETLLDVANRELESYQLQIIDLEAQIEDNVLIASTSGVVMLEKEIIEGEILQPGITLLYIVPDNNEYKVTLYVSDRDIAKVKVGEVALLSVNAFPYQEYGRLQCSINYVSVTSLYIENVGQVYRVEATLSDNAFGKDMEEQYEVSAGMTVEADIVYGTESWMSWLLKEIHFK